MNGHEQYAALLDAYIDGALSEQDAARVREHLTQCPECQSYVSDALTMRELFPGIEETPVPEGFLESVMSSLPAQKIVWRRQWKKIAAPLAACVAVVALIGGLSGLRMGGAASMDSGGAAPESAEFNGAAYSETETPLESAEAPEAELYSVTAANWDDEASPDAEEYQAAVVTSDSGVAAAQSALDGGGTSWSASERAAAAGSVAAASRNGAALKSAPESETASESAFDGDSASENGAAAKFASNGGAAAESALDGGGVTAGETAPDGGAVSDSETAQNQNASAFDDTDAPASGAAFDNADTMPPQATESAPVPAPSGFPQGEAALTSAAPSDALPDAYATEESTPEEMAVTEAFPLSVSVWTLAPDAASVIMERYPPDAVTDSGVWYVLTEAQFEDLCKRLTDIEITSGPETVDADDLPDGAPAPTVADAIYIFAPTE